VGAITYSNLDSKVVGVQRVVRGTGTMSTSYATGGDTFSPAAIGLSRLDDLQITDPGLGVLHRWNLSTTAPKVLAYRDSSSAANAAFPEVAAAQNLAATGIFRFEAIGG